MDCELDNNICSNVQFLDSDNYIVILWEKILFLTKYVLKYLGIREHDICNLLWDGLEEKCIYFFELIFELVLKFSSKFEILSK